MNKMKRIRKRSKSIEENFKRGFDWIDAETLDEILEYLQDCGYLSRRGLELRHRFWKYYIKEE